MALYKHISILYEGISYYVYRGILNNPHFRNIAANMAGALFMAFVFDPCVEVSDKSIYMTIGMNLVYVLGMEIKDESKIFVSIPAFNEKFLYRTVEDLFAKAHIPERVFVGIFNQKTNDKIFEDFSEFPNVRVMNVHFDMPTGMGMAKMNASSLHDGEKYFFQIDAHSFFVMGWDSTLVNEYEHLKQNGIDKPILSQLINWHTVDKYDSYEYQQNMQSSESLPLKVNERGDTTHNRDPKPKFLDKFIEHYCITGPFMFTSSSFIYEVSYDFRITYSVEQESIAMRAWTRGYRIFASDRSVVSTLTKQRIIDNEVIFDSENFPDDAQNDLVPGNKEIYKKLSFHKIPNNVFFEILRGGTLGWFGAPTKELHEEYIKNLGFDFTTVEKLNDCEKMFYPDYLTKSIY